MDITQLMSYKLTFTLLVHRGGEGPPITTYSVTRASYSQCRKRSRRWLRHWCQRKGLYVHSWTVISRSIITGEIKWQVIVGDVDIIGQRVIELRRMAAEVRAEIYAGYFEVAPPKEMLKENVIKRIVQKEREFLAFLTDLDL